MHMYCGWKSYFCCVCSITVLLSWMLLLSKDYTIDFSYPYFIVCCVTLTGTTMLNGYLPGDGHNKSSTDESPGSDTAVGCSPVATLCNLGNTCFLNSVIYTLRFAPAFLHNLHHLADDLGDLTSKQQQVKVCRWLICLSNALWFYFIFCWLCIPV